MPKNFDSTLDEDLAFVAGGRTYTMKLCGYQVLARHDDENATDAPSNLEAGRRLVDRLADYLIDADRDDFLAAVEDGKIPFAQLQDILIWANGVQTGRPTNPPTPSESGRGGTAASSSDASVSSQPARPRTRTPARR